MTKRFRKTIQLGDAFNSSELEKFLFKVGFTRGRFLTHPDTYTKNGSGVRLDKGNRTIHLSDTLLSRLNGFTLYLSCEVGLIKLVRATGTMEEYGFAGIPGVRLRVGPSQEWEIYSLPGADYPQNLERAKRLIQAEE